MSGMQEVMREHTKRIEELLADVDSWEGRHGNDIAARLKAHAAEFEEMTMGVRRWEKGRECSCSVP